MTGDIVGADLLIVLPVVVIAAVTIGIPIWAIVDAAMRPTQAFSAAGSSKGTWISLIAVFWILTGIVGLVLACVYLVSIRPRVKAAVTH